MWLEELGSDHFSASDLLRWATEFWAQMIIEIAQLDEYSLKYQQIKACIFMKNPKELSDLKLEYSATDENLKNIIANHPRLKNISLSGCNDITNEGVFYLAELTQLQSIDLGECSQITDISPLEKLTQLQSINLSMCNQITDISSLANLTQLQSINLYWSSQITDISPLANLTELQHINLGWCSQITDISPLANLTQLQRVDLSECFQITDISPLANLAELQSVSLSGCSQLTDVSPLANLTQIQNINLYGCHQITGIPSLTNLTQLQSINLYRCNQITDFSFLHECENLVNLTLPNGQNLQGIQVPEWLSQAQFEFELNPDLIQETLQKILNQTENDTLKQAVNNLLNVLNSNEPMQTPESIKIEVLKSAYYLVKRSIESDDPETLDEALQGYEQAINNILENLDLDKGLKEKIAGSMLVLLGVVSLIFAVAVIGSFCLVACPALLAAAPAAIIAIATSITSTGTALLTTEGLLVAAISAGVIGAASVVTSCMFFQKETKKSKDANDFRENLTEQTENLMNAITQL